MVCGPLPDSALYSNAAEILPWRDSQALVLDFVSECLFIATVRLVPGTAATGCGIIAATIPVMAVMLICRGSRGTIKKARQSSAAR